MPIKGHNSTRIKCLSRGFIYRVAVAYGIHGTHGTHGSRQVDGRAGRLMDGIIAGRMGTMQILVWVQMKNQKSLLNPGKIQNSRSDGKSGQNS